MSLYTKESVERVKEAADMVELVSARTDLRRVGTRHVGLCPFHDERTPSFSVNAESKLYHCFGCGESGDAIRFVEGTEALDFPGAIEALAERYGVELKREREDPRAEERRRRRERLLALTERAAAYYARRLWESAEAESARGYLSERGLSEEVLRDFRIGYAPRDWDRLAAAARRSGFGADEIVAAGLGQAGRTGRFHDRFRSRIMFPLADARGRVLGFGARALEDGQQPKYLNSAESELYRKGRQLFGIDRARAAAARAARIVVVEGYTDVLALHQAGLHEAVAIMGTALTQDQLAELARAAPMIVLALDADRSGQEAMLRAARHGPDRGAELRVVRLPEGSDPADLVAAEGADAFRTRLESTLTVPEFEAHRVLADADLRTPTGRDRALAELRPLVALTPPRSATRDELVRLVVDRLEVPPDYVLVAAPPAVGAARQLAAAPGEPARGGGERAREGGEPGWGRGEAGRGGGQPGSVRGAPGREGDEPRWGRGERGREGPQTADQAPRFMAGEASERAFLALCLSQGSVGREYLVRAGDALIGSEALRAVRDHLLAHFDQPLSALPADPPLAGLVDHIALLAEREPSSEQALRLSFLQLELRRIERELRQAAEAGDLERQRALWPPRADARAQIDELMGAAS